MREQHLSDEAIAAFADDVLAGHARDRARAHTVLCAECNYAVAVQREAIWALRSAVAPSLPIGLLDRLRDVPVTTPISRTPVTIDGHGTAMFATFAAPVVAFVAAPSRPRSRRTRPLAMTAASMAFVGALSATVAASGAAIDEPAVAPASVQVPGATVPATHVRAPGGITLAGVHLHAW